MGDLSYLFLNALLISAMSFGGGTQALFYQTMVEQKTLISSADLSAVLAFGYATPGPAVFGTATFVGYHIGGLPGVLIGTVGVFLLPCLLALAAVRYLGHWLDNPHAKLFVQGVGLAAAGVVAAVAITISRPYLTGIVHPLIGIVALCITLRWNVNPLVVLLGGLLMGLLLG